MLFEAFPLAFSFASQGWSKVGREIDYVCIRAQTHRNRFSLLFLQSLSSCTAGSWSSLALGSLLIYSEESSLDLSVTCRSMVCLSACTIHVIHTLSFQGNMEENSTDVHLRENWDCATLSPKPCKLQKLIPNHQFSFCCIYLLLLTLLTIRFSWPPSHHWASQGLYLTGLNPISMAGLSRWPGEGRYPQNINWSLGFLRDRFLDPSSSPHTLHHRVPWYKHMVSHTIAILMTHSSISHFEQMIQR